VRSSDSVCAACAEPRRTHYLDPKDPDLQPSSSKSHAGEIFAFMFCVGVGAEGRRSTPVVARYGGNGGVRASVASVHFFCERQGGCERHAADCGRAAVLRGAKEEASGGPHPSCVGARAPAHVPQLHGHRDCTAAGPARHEQPLREMLRPRQQRRCHSGALTTSVGLGYFVRR